MQSALKEDWQITELRAFPLKRVLTSNPSGSGLSRDRIHCEVSTPSRAVESGLPDMSRTLTVARSHAALARSSRAGRHITHSLLWSYTAMSRLLLLQRISR